VKYGRSGGEASFDKGARRVVTPMKAAAQLSRRRWIGGNACTDQRESWDGRQALVDTDRFGAKSKFGVTIALRVRDPFCGGRVEAVLLVPLAYYNHLPKSSEVIVITHFAGRVSPADRCSTTHHFTHSNKTYSSDYRLAVHQPALDPLY
jgi:hypothetical protein